MFNKDNNFWLGNSFLNSTKLNTADTIKVFKPIAIILNQSRGNIKSDYFFYKMKTRSYYKEFKENAKGKIYNMPELYYKNLFDTSENGKTYFLLKDPDDNSSVLTPDQRKFLK